MSFVKRSTFFHAEIHIPKKPHKPELIDIFIDIRDLLRQYQKNLRVKKNTPVHYELWTDHGFRVINCQYRTSIGAPGRQVKSRTGMLFAAVVLYKGWVSLYIHPLYLNSSLAENISDNLRSLFFRNSRSCLHISYLTPELTEEIRQLVARGWDYYVSQSWVKPLD
jgi:hypothetical protein